MAKPIIITDDMKQKAQDEFSDLLTSMKMTDGRISYSKAFKYEKASAILWLSQLAYSKTVALVTEFSDEVAWHGLAIRSARNEFLIEDIFVYPQEVTGSTVSTDQAGYSKWLYEFDDETFNKIRMQGHSHVSMGVSPSGVDSGHREKILDQLDGDMLYIFMIWNKRLETHTLIYDMENNILYEDSDITVRIAGDDSLEAFLADAKAKVQQRKTVYHVKTKGEKRSKAKGEAEPDELGSLFDRYHDYGRIYDPYEL